MPCYEEPDIDPRAIDYREILESTPLVPWVADAQTWRFTYVGPQAAGLLGFPVEDWYGESFWADRIHPDDRELAISTCTTLSEEGGSYEFEYRMVRADGDIIWVNDIVSVETGDAGPVTLRGFLIDITEQKALSSAVTEGYDRVQRLLQDAPDAILSVRADGSIARANKVAQEMFGFSEGELVGSLIERLIPTRLGWSHVRHRARFVEEPSSRHMGRRLDLLARKRDGSEFPVEVSLSPFEAKDVFHVIAAVRDVSDRRHVEEELRANERLLRQMVNTLPVLMAFVDTDQRYRFANHNYGKWFDLDPTQMVGRTAREVMGHETYARVQHRIESALQGEHSRSEVVFPARDGRPATIEMAYVPHFDEDGAVVGYFVIGSDVSDRAKAHTADREHRETLAHFSRVATMGELAGSIAHELNQPLAAISANAQAARRFLAMTPPDLTEIDEALGDVAADAKRAANVIRHMRDLLRKGESRREVTDIVSLIDETVEMLNSDAIARNCSIVVESDQDIPLLSGDPIQLKQVILNLAMNAFDAVSGEAVASAATDSGDAGVSVGGTAASAESNFGDASMSVGGGVSSGGSGVSGEDGVSAGTGGPGRGDVLQENSTQGSLVITTTTSNGCVDISFVDNGPGFPDDTTIDFFAPFVTTKPDGLGMGLSVSRSIIEAHGAELRAESNPQGGATLRILWPLPTGEAE